MNIDIFYEIKSLDNTLVKYLFHISKEIEGFKPKPLQLRILRYLKENIDKEIFQRDLEEHFKISKAAVSDVLNTMEKNGMIERIASENDARCKRIIITDSSLKKSNDIEIKIKNLNNKILQSIDSDDLETFLKVSNKIKDNIKKEG